MVRKLRIQFPGAVHHLVNRGILRRDFFPSPADAKALLKSVAALRVRGVNGAPPGGVLLHAFGSERRSP